MRLMMKWQIVTKSPIYMKKETLFWLPLLKFLWVLIAEKYINIQYGVYSSEQRW